MKLSKERGEKEMNPYKVLEISENATEDEIKEAYKRLARKYHPDNYEGGEVPDAAKEKMEEINNAYDMIMNKRRGGFRNDGQYVDSNSNNVIRDLIMEGNIDEADQILNEIPSELRDAEWHFLKGSVLLKRGWLEESYNNFSKACSIDPYNKEYRAAFNRVKRQRDGLFGDYNTMASPGGCGCSSCDVCTSLICADCCCECMGGDFIRCC